MRSFLEFFEEATYLQTGLMKQDALKYRGQMTEDEFARIASQKGFVVIPASPEEDRVQRWDFKLAEKNKQVGQSSTPFKNNPMNVKFPPDPKFAGTVDVKSSTFPNGKLKVYIRRNNIGDTWILNTNWVAIKDGQDMFILIHRPTIQKYMEQVGKVKFVNANNSNCDVISTDATRPLRFTNNTNQVSLPSGIWYRDDKTDDILTFIPEVIARRFSIRIS